MCQAQSEDKCFIVTTFIIFFFSKYSCWKVTTYCKQTDLIRIITPNTLDIIIPHCVLLSHECYCMNPTPYSLLFALLLCLAEQLKPDLSSAALLPCKTWLRFHFETESDSCCPASSNVSSSADTKEDYQDKHLRDSKAFYFYICTCMVSATGIDKSSSLTIWYF